MSAAGDLADLVGWVDGTADRVRRAAASAPRGGDEAWRALLAELGVTALDEGERARHLAQGAPMHKGALPIELRWAMEAIVERAAPHARRIDMSVETGDAATQRGVDRLQARLSLLVQEELRAYLASVRPTVTTSSIFAAALATSPNYLAQDGAAAGVSTSSCTCCGAPRREAGRRSCEFCGSNLE